MAVILKDFSWSQTSSHVVVRVPLRGIHSSKVDLLTHNIYIKASFKPFLFEAFLLYPIIESTSEALIVNEEILFNLEKSEKNIQWESLCQNLNKEEKHKKRERVIEEISLQHQEHKAKKQELLQNLQRKAVQQQIDLETKEKVKINELRNTERDNAMKDLETWKNQREALQEKDCTSKNSGEKKCDESLIHSSQSSESIGNSPPNRSEDIWSTAESIGNSPTNRNEDIWSTAKEKVSRTPMVKLTEEDLKPVPFTRKSGCIKVKFTPRAFPTPQRESRTDEEHEWLKKQAEARRATGFVAEDLRPEECNPQWLKDKGDSFFKVGNYLGAVSAYSHGIKLNDKMSSLYVNRSAAHLVLGNLKRVIEDTSMALELMVPRVKLNEESRMKCHARRGAALCKLGMLEPGLKDLEEAFQFRPHDDKLQRDIEAVKVQLKTLKENGDMGN